MEIEYMIWDYTAEKLIETKSGLIMTFGSCKEASEFINTRAKYYTDTPTNKIKPIPFYGYGFTFSLN